jgi:hypothetical protein
MKKYLVVLIVFGLAFFHRTPLHAATQEVPSPSTSLAWMQSELVPRMIQSISTTAVDTAYDYLQRPIIGIIISDFRDDQGREIVIGKDLAYWLRAGLNKEKQFFVYDRRHPVYKSLETILAVDPSFKPAWQKRFQENLAKNFSNLQLDLILTGTIVKESEDRLKVTTSLIPLFKKIRPIETEYAKGKSSQAVFLSPPLSSSEINIALKILPKGRLVVLAHLDPKFEQIDPGQRTDQEKAHKIKKARKGGVASRWDFRTPNDLNIWLDDGKLSLIKIKNWPEWRQKEYEDLFSGFETDTLWFDDNLDEGPHFLFFSLSPSKDQYKTFSRTIDIKSGANHYLVFTLGSDLMGNPELIFNWIVDPLKKPLPF